MPVLRIYISKPQNTYHERKKNITDRVLRKAAWSYASASVSSSIKNDKVRCPTYQSCIFKTLSAATVTAIAIVLLVENAHEQT